MRVAFEDGAIHKRAGVAFVGIAYHVFFVGIVFARDFPFQSCGKSGAAAATQPRFLNDIDGFLRRVLGKAFAQRLIRIAGNGFVDVLRVNRAAIPERYAQLFFVESHVF